MPSQVRMSRCRTCSLRDRTYLWGKGDSKDLVVQLKHGMVAARAESGRSGQATPAAFPYDKSGRNWLTDGSSEVQRCAESAQPNRLMPPGLARSPAAGVGALRLDD